MRLNQVTVPLVDYAASMKFYLKLGLKLIVDAPPRYARFQCPDGDATLSIEVTGEAPASSRAQLFFECDTLDATVDALRAKGFVFAQEPTDMPYLWREAWLRDLDGHDIRLYFPGKNWLDPPWKLNQR